MITTIILYAICGLVYSFLVLRKSHWCRTFDENIANWWLSFSWWPILLLISIWLFFAQVIESRSQNNDG